MRVRKISYSKSDLHGHSRPSVLVKFDAAYRYDFLCLYLVPFPRYYQFSLNLKRSRDRERIAFGGNLSCMRSYTRHVSVHIRFEIPSCNYIFQDMIGATKFQAGSLDSDPPPPGVISHSKANTWYSLTVYKFDDFSFSRFRDMTGASSQIKDGKRPLSVVVCHPWIVTFLYMCNLNLPAKFEVSLFPPVTTIWKATQNIENGIGLGVVRGHSRSLKIAPLDRAIEFLLAFCCNSDGLVYCFWYIAR